MARQYSQLGEQITRLMRSLAAVHGWSMTYTMGYIGGRIGYSPDMLHRWRQGRSYPSHETIEVLARVGKEEANLDRKWGESLFKTARYLDAASLVDNIWGPKEIRSILQNLPPLAHTDLIGRQAEVAHLLELLSPQMAAHLITVDGIGGVGKTALVLEVAYRCWRASTGQVPNPKTPTFDAIIFVSAKQEYLTPAGILPRLEAQSTLRDIFREAARTLNRFEITRVGPQDQHATVREALTRQRTLLIVDNLEIMEDRQEIMAFLFELPLPVKVVITTREQELFSPIRLEQLVEEKALELIRREANEKKAYMSNEDAQMLYLHIGGIPAALVYAIGQMASGYSVGTVLDRIPEASSDVARFCFEKSIAPFRGQRTHHLLMSLAMFSKSPLRTAAVHTVGLVSDPFSIEDSLAQLQRLSLISQQGGRYGMLPLTREYALMELMAYPKFEQEARKRWIEWYLEFTKEYGGDDWEEWHIPYDRIEEEWDNLLAVFEWCAKNERYEAIQRSWRPESVGSVLEFAYVYGYWDDRLVWLRWLNQQAERRGDWTSAVGALSEAGFTLTLMDQLTEAEQHLKRAWDLHKHVEKPGVQMNLVKNLVVLAVHQEDYEEARERLGQFVALIDAAQLDERERTRRWFDVQYYHGIISYKECNYDQAEAYFREIVEISQNISWHRATTYAQNWLADIAIAQGRLNDAEDLLQIGLPVSVRNRDRRRTPHFQSSYAHLYEMRGNIDEARYWAREAKDGFESLGARREMEEMDKLLQRLQG